SPVVTGRGRRMSEGEHFMKTLFIGLAMVPLFTVTGWASIQLTDAQLDAVTAGQVLGIECPGCTLSSSSSMSNNGVTVTITSTTIVPPETGGTGETGGNGGNGGGNGGTGGNTGPTGPAVVTSIPVPPNLAGLINAANTISTH